MPIEKPLEIEENISMEKENKRSLTLEHSTSKENLKRDSKVSIKDENFESRSTKRRRSKF